MTLVSWLNLHYTTCLCKLLFIIIGSRRFEEILGKHSVPPVITLLNSWTQMYSQMFLPTAFLTDQVYYVNNTFNTWGAGLSLCMVESPLFVAEQFSWYICFGITINSSLSNLHGFYKEYKDSLFYNVPENVQPMRSENRHGDQNFNVGRSEI
jgi:hypothetical protein